MKSLIVIGEGKTEKVFVDEVLRPYFWGFDIYDVTCTTLEGVSTFSALEKSINKLIARSNLVVSTMVDFYELPGDFPGMEEFYKSEGYHHNNGNHLGQVKLVEERIKERIYSTIGDKRRGGVLIPYIQLHEFEALIFSSENGIEKLFDQVEDEIKIEEFKKIVSDFPNPENINSGKKTAPSKRLEDIVPGYNKPLYGSIILKEIGVEALLNKCPHFKEWIDKLKSAIMETTPDSNAG